MSNGNEQTDAVETVHSVETPIPPGRLWNPVVGEQLRGTLQLQTLSDEEREIIEQQTVSILGKSFPPSSSQGQETGLALGYVQSGKTLSFTCVAALASDNRFPLVIVITGTSELLFQQSVRRLRQDLGIDNPVIHDRRWQFFENPRVQNNHQDRIRAVLAEWQEPRIHDKQTCLITVMKHHQHLNHLIELLRGLDLRYVPTLVIDDEADQAGLNTLVNKNDESRTYQRLLTLRATLPHHTYLQYTATPQAPLLINIIDVLSPRFIEVLEPGRNYVGVIDFFRRNTELVETIPDDEIPSEDNPINGAPESLRNALRLFFIGVAAGKIQRSPGNRSMLVHPSRLQEKHADYFQWVTAVRNNWLQLLGSEGDPDRVTLLNELRASHAELAATYPSLPSFSEVEQELWQAINRTQVIEVNARRGKTPPIDWRSRYAQILVGGQAMDRGFTVEGLTITYMPRGKGVGNADTIQQRARFLGYKRSYLGLCRVFLESEVQDAFTAYVGHEEHLREQLRQHSTTGRPLSEWRRAFFLDQTFEPTRRCVLDLDYENVNFSSEWFYPHAPHFTQSSVEHNRALVNSLIGSLNYTPDNGHEHRTDAQRHGYARVTLEELYNSFLTQLQFVSPGDSQQFIGLLLQLKEYLNTHSGITASVYLMSWSPNNGQVPRIRSVDEDSEIEQLFQGASIERGQFRRGEVYPGDREVKFVDEFTMQIHLLNLQERESQNQILAERVPAIAIWMPADMGTDTLVQDLPA
jgi:hypothetical protein